jgi:hypothetical protein
MGGEWWYPVFFGGNRPVNVPESDLEPCSTARTIEDLLRDGIYGNKESFSKLLTFTKLQFPLRNNIYSFKASRTDFKAYQFKPLLKFFENPKQRLLVADEVGLGKTIEAGLILSELRARHPETLDRVLVICPSALCLKWQTELRNRFNERFDILDSGRVRQFLDEFDREGESVKLKAICSVQTLRSRGLLEQWEALAPPIDLVIIDEAHHLRNPSTLSHRMGRALGDNADGLLLLTATPIHLGNANLFYLMRLLDPEQFGTNPDSFEDELGERLFEELVRANEPVVKTERMLRAQFPPDLEACMNCLRAVERGSRSQLFTGHYEYRELLDEFRSRRPPTRRDVVQMQRRLANLNLLGTYFTRSRKRDVEARVVRVAKSFSVHWTPQERLVYDAVTAHATEKHADKGAFALFLAMIPQRQIASCIPAAVSRYEKQLNLTVGGRDREESDFDIEDWIEDAEAEPVEQLDLSDGLFALADVGAGTTDVSFCRLVHAPHVTSYQPGNVVNAEISDTMAFYEAKTRAIGSDDVDQALARAIALKSSLKLTPSLIRSAKWAKEKLGNQKEIIAHHQGRAFSLTPDDVAKHLAAAISSMLIVYKETNFAAYKKEAIPGRWNHYSLLLLGGGTRLRYVQHAFEQCRPSDYNRKIELLRLTCPKDLKCSKSAQAQFDLLAIAYGLSFSPLDYPRLFRPAEVEPLRPLGSTQNKKRPDRDELYPK